MYEPHPLARSLRVAIFDVDGTLVTDTIHRDKHNFILGHVCHRPDLMLSPQEWNRISGLSDEDAYHYLSHQAAQRSYNLADFLPESTYLGIVRRYVNTHLGRLHIRHGVRDIIIAAEALGLLLGVATNADWPETNQKLIATDLLKHFRFFSCLDGIMAPKPAPDLYVHSMKAARRQGGRALDPSQVIVFEDTEVGATAAASAGCRVILWPGKEQKITLSELFCNNKQVIVARTAEDCIRYLRAASGL